MRLPLALSAVTAMVLATLVSADWPASAAVPFEIQSLDGSGNNVANPTWGQSGRPYARVAPARYTDGRSAPVAGPNSRAISNRMFNDVHQNIFSERGVTQWGFTWGQFLDHTFGLRLGGAQNDPQGESANIAFNPADPMESFRNDFGSIGFNRSVAAPGTGVDNPRQQVNSISSYIDAALVYGGSTSRLEWLRQGPVDGNMANNSALLMLPNGYLPRRDARGNAAAAPAMDVDGRLLGQPNRAAVAGDVRANESMALEGTQTLFAREHNRIVNLLPSSLSQEDRFQIARRIVIAEEQYVTYTEFLPAMGVNLPAYNGYQPNVDATLSNEFATVGYRAHSQIHGEVELETEASRYSQATLDALTAQGVEVAVEDGTADIAVPLGVGFFNPDLVEQLQLGPLMEAIGDESEYNNDEQIDNQLRSVLFQVPVSGNPECLDGPTLPECFNGVVDLGAIDIERGRDHGMPSYNQLRAAYGLAPKTSFTAITGESTDQFPTGMGIDNPNSLTFSQLTDLFGVNFGLTEERDPVRAVRNTTRAARLRALYQNVNNVDAFVGMVAEPHAPGSDLGELQRAIWAREFQRLRDGDRFFYANDPGLTFIRNTYGIDFRRNLGDIIASNTDIPRSDLARNVFFVGGNVPPTSCRVQYQVTGSWTGGFNAGITINNTGSTAIPAGWTLRFVFANGQVITDDWNGVTTQDEARVPMVNESWNAAIPAGGSVTGIGFTATWNNVTNGPPTRVSLNTTACST
ncbi:peroxidase family protein [Actinophytocola sp.]|uniref:peroxidase family protein n=1 Tax=Actinophytocola sp. TaxID=1872138 RepID=UPI002D3F7A97|nr:peroxidase family protein [Actinophytocola sp.]HYQ67800.1 peroxidase family protein [Actinophytocola sp.]